MIHSDAAVALVGDLVRAVLAVVSIGLVAGFLAYYTAVARVMFHDLHMNDFGKSYYSTRAFLDGGAMYAPSPATAMPVGNGDMVEFANLNPPHFHLLLLPIARLDPLVALLIWTLVSLIAFGASLRIISRELDLRWTPAGALWALAGFLAGAPTQTMVYTGQVTFLLMLPFTTAWAAARHGRWIQAASLFGLIASIKPVFGIVGIVLLARRQMKAAAIMALVAISCLLVGVVIFGWDAYASWFNVLNNVQWAWAVMNGSFHGPLARTLNDNPFFEPLLRAPQFVEPVATALGVLVVSIALAATVRDSRSHAPDRAFALLILAALLASPIGWIYYMWLALGPLAALWTSGALRRWPMPGSILLVAAVGLLYPIELTLVAHSQPWGGFTVGSIYTWTTLLLWLSVLVSASSGGRAPLLAPQRQD